jgi:hypothetical protein
LKNRRIFRHPVGIFPMGARWYLASIAMLTLLCVAAHLSVQIHAQQMAEKLLHQWGKKAQVEIGDVHYHLLRNGLIVRQIHIEREGGSLSIAHMLIRANPRLLTGDSPQIGQIEMDGVKVRLWDSESENTWQQDEYLQRIWHASRSLSLRDGELVIIPQGESESPLEMTGLKLQQDYLNQQRRLVGSAHTGEGSVHVEWQTNEEDGSSSGQLRWQEMDAELLSSLLGLQPVVGFLSGYMNWSQADSAEPGVESAAIEGRVQLNNAADELIESQQLHWQGSQVAGTWKLEVTAKDWPLDAWAEVLPKIGGGQILAGQLDGPMQWQGQPGKWKVNADQGVLRNVVYAMGNERKTADWRVGRLEFKHALIEQSKRHLQASSILLADVNVTLQPAPALADDVLEKKPGADWHLSVDDIHIQNMMLGLSLEQGKVVVPPLHGKGSWKPGKALNFKLQTQTAAEKTAKAQAEKTMIKKAEYWQLRGQVLQSQTVVKDTRLHIQARNVPLAKLRALVPLTGSKTSPLTLEGNTSLKLDISIHDGVWQAAGQATADAVVLAHASNSWNMDHLTMSFGPVGMGLDSQSIKLIEVQGWKYITALNPLSAHSAETSAETDSAVEQPLWWAESLRRQNWKIDTVRMNSGTVSLGRSEDYWARQLDIRMDQLQAGQWSKLNIAGVVGGGDFTVKGTWDALGEVNRFRGMASLENALPFFLHNWMTASGMPRLIRGRISADISVKDGASADSYQSLTKLRFLRGLTEMSLSPDDPLLSRTGFGTSEILLRLDDGAGKAGLQFETSGSWRTQALNMGQLGMSMQSALQQAVMQQAEKEDQLAPEKQRHSSQTRIRLHERGVLSLNERVRLFKVVRLLRKNPDWVIDLTPHWTGDEMNADVLKRVLYTQNLIERYLLHRKVSKQRIFPSWPTIENQVDDIGSIWVSIGPPA